MQPWQDRRTSPMLLLSEHYSSWYWLIGGYIRSPIPAAQDLRVLVDSHLMLSKHVKVHTTRNCFDCFGIIIVWSIYFSIFRQFHWKLTILWACKNWVFARKLWYSNCAAKVPRDLDCDVVLVPNSQAQDKICAELASKPKRRGGRYCVAGAPNNHTFQNTLFSPVITMHQFPTDAVLREK